MSEPNSPQENHTDDKDIPEDGIGDMAKETLLENPQRIVRDTLFAIVLLIGSGSVATNQSTLYTLFDTDLFVTTIIYLSYGIGILSTALLGMILLNVLLAVMIIVVDSWEIA